jgi:hypothetical protein
VFTASAPSFNNFAFSYKTDVALDTRAYFKIKAMNSIGNSSFSPEILLIAAVPPQVVGSFKS